MVSIIGFWCEKWFPVKEHRNNNKPEHDLVFHMFSNRITMAAKCAVTPENRNIFISVNGAKGGKFNTRKQSPIECVWG